MNMQQSLQQQSEVEIDCELLALMASMCTDIQELIKSGKEPAEVYKAYYGEDNYHRCITCTKKL